MVPRRYVILLGVLTALFALRIAGQLVVAVFDVSFLPQFKDWYSGLVPYPLLLPAQILLLGLMLAIVRDIARARGFFATLTRRTGRIMMRLGYLYAAVMAMRYALTMMLHPELRWFTGTTPIWFHFVLASFLFTLGHFHATRPEGPDKGLVP